MNEARVKIKSLHILMRESPEGELEIFCPYGKASL